MFDNYVLRRKVLRNVKEDNKIVGYEMLTNITYYRSIPLSMIHDMQLVVDQVEVPREDIRFSPDGENFFTLDEMETVTSYKWEYGVEGIVRVIKDGGLTSGEHEVTLTQVSRVSYIPVPFSGTQTKIMEVKNDSND